jgi:hypothetical protein
MLFEMGMRAGCDFKFGRDLIESVHATQEWCILAGSEKKVVHADKRKNVQ